MSTTGGFVAGSIIAKLLMDKSGWNASVKALATDQRMMTGTFGKIGASAQMIGVVAAAAISAAVVALGVMVKKTTELGDQLYEMSQKTGISVELLSSYKLAAEKAGSSLEGLAIGIRFLSRNIFDAGRGVKLTQQYFDDLGISIKGWSKQLPDVNATLLQIADRFAGMQDGAEKSALAIKILGRSGTELIPFLNLGSQGLKEEAELAKKLGIVFTEKTAVAAHELSHTLKDLGGGFQGLRNTIANAIIPIVNEFARGAVDALIFLQGKIQEFADSGQLREWAISTAKVFVGAIKIIVQGVELLAIAIPSISAGISKALAVTQDAVAGIADSISGLVGQMSGVGSAAAVGYKMMAESARGAAAALRTAAAEQIDKAAEMVVPYETLITALDILATSFGKTVPPAKKAAAEIKTAFDSLSLKNKLQLTFSSDIAEKVADITLALKVFKEQLTPEAERKLRDELQALGDKFGFLKTSVDATFRSDVQKKIDDVAMAIKMFQDRMTPEAARRLSAELEHLADDTDYLRTELGLTFTSDVTKKIDDIQLALKKYKGQLTPEAERKLRDELQLLGNQFGYLKTQLNLTFKSDIKTQIDDIATALANFGDRLPAEEVIRLKNLIRDLKREFDMPLKTAEMIDSINRFVAGAQPILNGFDAIFTQAQRNREIAIDNEYKKRLDFINKTVKDETKKQMAITALEAEYEIKRSHAASAAAKMQKAASLAQAIINVAEAYTKALAQGGFIFGIPMATVIAALGAIQIAMIMAQPIPLAEGAAFEKPTLVNNALVGEAGPEYLLPEKKLINIVQDAMAPLMAKGRSEVPKSPSTLTVAMEAIVNAADAVVRAFKNIVGAFNSIQIGVIQTQPTALAAGAAFDRPTRIKDVLIGEAGPEYVLPETKLVNIVRNAFTLPRFAANPAMAMVGGGVNSGGTVTLNFNGPLVSSPGVSMRDLEAAGENLVVILDRQLKRVGRRL